MLHTISIKVSFSDDGMTADDIERIIDTITDAAQEVCEEVEKDTPSASAHVAVPRATEAQIAKLAYVGVSRT